MKFAIGLTGGIGSGKSSFCSLLRLYGFDIVDSDKIAHEVLDKNSSFISSTFGLEYLSHGRVDRKRLAPLIFENPQKKELLESKLHPLIREEIYAKSEELDKKEMPYILDIPLLFETNAYDVRRSILVYAPKEELIRRVIKRDNLTKDEAIRRVESQMDIEKKRELADIIIDNSKNLKNLQNECDRAVLLIKKEFNVSI